MPTRSVPRLLSHQTANSAIRAITLSLFVQIASLDELRRFTAVPGAIPSDAIRNRPRARRTRCQSGPGSSPVDNSRPGSRPSRCCCHNNHRWSRGARDRCHTYPDRFPSSRPGRSRRASDRRLERKHPKSGRTSGTRRRSRSHRDPGTGRFRDLVADWADRTCCIGMSMCPG